MSQSTQKIVRITLGVLLLLVALNAFAGGYYGMAGAEGVPVEWLSGSPFKDYFIPGLFLFACVGGACLFAAIAVFKKHRFARIAALGSAFLILSWIGIQVAIIGYVSWMQPATTIAALAILSLTFILFKNERHDRIHKFT